MRATTRVQLFIGTLLDLQCLLLGLQVLLAFVGQAARGLQRQLLGGDALIALQVDPFGKRHR